MKYFDTFTGIGGLIEAYESGLTQAEVGIKFGITQKQVHLLFRQHGYKCRVAKKRNQFREFNDSWKGDKATYHAFHRRVESVKGKPRFCEICKSTVAKYYDWANLTGKYEDIDDYKRMCKSCHAKFDNKINNIIKK